MLLAAKILRKKSRIFNEEAKMPTMSEIQQSDKIEDLRKQFDNVLQIVITAAEGAEAVDKVERTLWSSMMRIGKGAMGLYFSLAGDGDAGERVNLPDGKEVVRLKNRHVRKYRSVFGEFTLPRAVYGTREGQKIEYVPLDARLQL
ncbi:MAG: hypothetical protein BECKG1743F_GA0114225_111111, partial [Candidatus Kentron sp. G]